LIRFGVQMAPLMRNTVVDISDLGATHTLRAIEGSPGKFFQSMIFGVEAGDLVGKPKGAEKVLEERGLLVPGMLLNHKTRPELCMRTVLSKCLDFAAERPLVQEVIESHGQRVHWLPKYHSPCNASEYFWGNGKKRFRINCDYTMKHLKKAGMRTLFNIDERTGWKFIRKGRDYDNELRDGATGQNMDSNVRESAKKRLKHASHIRPAPSHYEEQ
jgi:hypothetical protein